MFFVQKKYLVLPLLLILGIAHGKTIRYTFDVSYVSGNPDGVWTNSILGINGKFPGPLIEAEAGDILQINVINSVQDGQNVTLHWHGILQKGTPFEDGPSQVTQCPIKSGSNQVYTFAVPLAGTFWYHSHVNSQYTEGLWGVMIVRTPEDPYRSNYNREILITLNDWYHTSGLENEEWLISPQSGGAPPFPSSALMNGVGRYPCNYAAMQDYYCSNNAQKRPVFPVQRGKTYRVRLVNTAGWTAFNFSIDGHTLTTIEVDGVDTQLSSDTTAEAVHIAAGQRYSFLVTTSRTASFGAQFLIRANLRKEFLFTKPGNVNPYPEALIQEVTGVFQYTLFGDSWGSSSPPVLINPSMESFDYTRTYANPTPWESLRFVAEDALVPLDGIPAPVEFDQSLELDISFKNDSDFIRRGSFNGRPFKLLPGRPQLAKFVEQLPLPEENFPVAVQYGHILQIVINNPEEGPHPIHLHGHHFWVMGMGHQGDGNYDPARHQLNYNGVKRDTALIKEHSWLVIKFRADNPGVWSLHCHVDWHMLTGMMMTIVEAPELGSQITIPLEARRVCAAHGIVI